MTGLPRAHLQCDSCNAVAPEGQQAGWETLTSESWPDAHLCPKCIDLRERRELPSNPLALRCPRCGRTPADGIKQWWTARGDQGEAIDVCDDCLDDERDFIVVP
jgi:hypothetical protein